MKLFAGDMMVTGEDVDHHLLRENEKIDREVRPCH